MKKRRRPPEWELHMKCLTLKHKYLHKSVNHGNFLENEVKKMKINYTEKREKSYSWNASNCFRIEQKKK